MPEYGLRLRSSLFTHSRPVRERYLLVIFGLGYFPGVITTQVLGVEECYFYLHSP